MEYFKSPWKLDIHVGRSSGREWQNSCPYTTTCPIRSGQKNTPRFQAHSNTLLILLYFFCKSNIYSEVVVQKFNLTLYHREGLVKTVQMCYRIFHTNRCIYSASNYLILKHIAQQEHTPPPPKKKEVEPKEK